MSGMAPQHAVVPSGGGAHGACEVGVLKALLAGAAPVTEGRPLEAEICCGGLLGLLNFERERLEALIDEGYRDAVQHDCEACECIVPAGRS